jgi:hypothetical protein
LIYVTQIVRALRLRVAPCDVEPRAPLIVVNTHLQRDA